MKGHMKNLMRAKGGGAGEDQGGTPKSRTVPDNVETEAEEGRKHGGKRKDGGHVMGHPPKKHRLDRPGRKRGGGIGADKNPLSTAARVKDAEGHHADEGNAADSHKGEGP